jgi:predicted nucleic acid-binding protein
MAALADTTVLSNFAQVLRPDLLRQAYPELIVPPAVRAELTAGERWGLVPVCDWSWLEIARLVGSEVDDAK